MLRYLSKDGKQKIESFQLQLLCQFAEKVVIDAVKHNREKVRAEFKLMCIGWNLKKMLKMGIKPATI